LKIVKHLILTCILVLAPPVLFADVLIYGGTIRTMDEANPLVQALLLRDGKIIAVGDKAALASQSRNPDEVDLLGRTLLPGFIDSHVHVRELGMDVVKANLVSVNTTAEMVERMKFKFPDPAPGEWLIGQGWDEGKFGSIGYPDRYLLDLAFPNNPVQLESLHGFAGFYNAAALKIAGITDSTPDPEVGQILRRENRQATGVMLTLAQALVSQHVPAVNITQREEAILAGLLMMAEVGVTSIHEAGMTKADVQAFINLRTRQQLPIRVYGMLNGNDNELMQQWFDRGPLVDSTKMLEIRGVKVFYDGSLGSRTALLRAPYSDHPEKANPTERISPKAVRQLAKNSAEHGFQMAVHAIGDEGNDITLTIYEDTLKNYPNNDARWRIEHAQVVLPDFYNRAAKVGLIASMQSSHAVGDSGWAEERVGPVRIMDAYAWQKMLGAGIPLAINSDLPGEPWKPVETLFFAVTRAKLNGVSELESTTGWYPNQSLSISEALRAMTLTNAYAAFQEQFIGSLEVGKYADFVILNRDPVTTKPQELKDLQVLETWVSGRQIYRIDNNIRK